jgi:dephospho-CoA kinase
MSWLDLLTELLFDLFGVLPLAALVAHCSIRVMIVSYLSVSRLSNKGPSDDTATTHKHQQPFYKLLSPILPIIVIGAVLLEFLLIPTSFLRINNIGKGDETSTSFDRLLRRTSTLARGWNNGSTSHAESIPYARLLASALMLSIRLACIILGVYLGESWKPIALTGGIATGKSTVASLLSSQDEGGTDQFSSTGGSKVATANSQSAMKQSEAKSVLIVDSDMIAHDILLPPWVLENEPGHSIQPKDSIYHQILQTFGDKQQQNANILADDQSKHIDRRKLGAIVFPDAHKRRALNKLTHPRIVSTLLKQIAHGLYRSSYDVICADIPLLYESGYLPYLFVLNLCVACDPDVQLERLMKRNTDLTEQQCRDRIASQMSLERKKKMAHIVIENDGGEDELRDKVASVRADVAKRLNRGKISLAQLMAWVGAPLTLALVFSHSGIPARS